MGIAGPIDHVSDRAVDLGLEAGLGLGQGGRGCLRNLLESSAGSGAGLIAIVQQTNKEIGSGGRREGGGRWSDWVLTGREVSICRACRSCGQAAKQPSEQLSLPSAPSPISHDSFARSAAEYTCHDRQVLSQSTRVPHDWGVEAC